MRVGSHYTGISMTKLHGASLVSRLSSSVYVYDICTCEKSFSIGAKVNVQCMHARCEPGDEANIVLHCIMP